MAAVPSLSEPQRSGDSHPAVSHLVQKHVEEVLAWQRRNGVQKIPSKYSGDCEERKLALRFEKLLLRRDKAVGTEPSRSQLSPSEVALVNSVPGVPLHGCSATASCSSTVARQLPESAAIEGPRHAPANCVGGPPSTSSMMQQIELVMMNGELLTTFKREDLENLTVEGLIENLEEGWVTGAHGAKRDDLGIFLERFSLVIQNEVFRRTMRTPRTMGLVTDYFPEGKESIQITLIKEPVEEALYQQLRRRARVGWRTR